jgi:hypothetical protein
MNINGRKVAKKITDANICATMPPDHSPRPHQLDETRKD